jgi:hypothetical protein
MWLGLITISVILGAAASLRLNIIGAAILSLTAFIFTSALGWLLSYHFLPTLIVALGGSGAIQVGFFVGLLAQICFGMRGAEIYDQN